MTNNVLLAPLPAGYYYITETDTASNLSVVYLAPDGSTECKTPIVITDEHWG